MTYLFVTLFLALISYIVYFNVFGQRQSSTVRIM